MAHPIDRPSAKVEAGSGTQLNKVRFHTGRYTLTLEPNAMRKCECGSLPFECPMVSMESIARRPVVPYPEANTVTNCGKLPSIFGVSYAEICMSGRTQVLGKTM